MVSPCLQMDISPGLAFLHLTASELIMRPADIDFHHKDGDQRPAWRKSLQSHSILPPAIFLLFFGAYHKLLGLDSWPLIKTDRLGLVWRYGAEHLHHIPNRGQGDGWEAAE